jgi:hypothetical protein
MRPHFSDDVTKRVSVGRILIMHKIVRCAVPRKILGDLACRPYWEVGQAVTLK